jgi:hypothetical protein
MNALLIKFLDHVFSCNIWIDFEKGNGCESESLNFKNSFMLIIIKLKDFFYIKCWSYLAVKT